MGRVRKIIAALLGAALFVPLGLGPAHAFDIGRNLAVNYITNGYAQLGQETELLASNMQGLCADRSQPALAGARQQFGSVVRAWSMIESVRFGPVLKDNRLERILFYPDRQGIGLRQVQKILGTRDQRAIHLDSLQKKSVAVQGLVAMEFVLFGTGADVDLSAKGDGFRCAYGLAVSQALRAVSREVLADWEAEGGIADHMAGPQATFEDYRTEDEVLRELLGIFVHSMELVRDTRLQQLVGSDARPGSARTALYKRAELTIESAAANIEGLRNALLLSGIADKLAETDRWAAGALDFEMQNFVRTAGEIADMPIAQAVQDQEAYGKLKYLMILTASIQRILVDQLAASLGLSAGFSSLDGD